MQTPSCTSTCVVGKRSLFGIGDFEEVWDRVRGCAGQEFKTVRGLPFTYKMSGDYLKPSRTNVELSKGDFRRAYELMPLTGPGRINRLVMGPAYVFAVLTDARIKT